MKDGTTPLFAVIETSEDMILGGKAPVMTVLRPMNWLMAAAYRWLQRHMPAAEKVDLQLNPYAVEYVVELAPKLFSILADSKQRTPSECETSRRIKLVLTPSIHAKAARATNPAGE